MEIEITFVLNRDYICSTVVCLIVSNSSIGLGYIILRFCISQPVSMVRMVSCIKEFYLKL